MADQYSYTVDNSIIIQDGNMIWNDTSHDQSLQFMDANDTIISDSTINENYVTAIDSNETQYLSILDSSEDVTLENMNLSNLTLEESNPQENIVFSDNKSSDATEAANNQEVDTNQVIVFTVEGSDDLYGIQMGLDQDGNLQKYQFRLRTTTEGNLEAVPETIELLPSEEHSPPPQIDNDDHLTESVQNHSLQEYFLVQSQLSNENDASETLSEQDEINHEIFIKTEPSQFQDRVSEEQLEDGLTQKFIQQEEENNSILNSVDIKSEVAALQSESILQDPLNIKEELSTDIYNNKQPYLQGSRGFRASVEPQHFIFDSQPQEINKDFTNMKNEGITENFADEDIGQVLEDNQKNIVHQFISENGAVSVQFENDSEELGGSSQQYEFKDVYNENENDGPELESDNDQYEIAEEFHVTDQTEDEQLQYDSEATEHTQEEIGCQDGPTMEHTNILKHSVTNSENNSKLGKPLMNVKYYLVYPEKENVNSMTDKQHAQVAIPRLTKANPRSVLRASFLKPKKVVKCSKNSPNEFPECDLFQKRFAKSKEAMQAKLFYNFINRTTIPQAPVRQTRQPRKQEIKPVSERRDEEIIVQEVMISASGFVENLNHKFKNKKLQVTAVVELSDSEDEPNSKNRRLSRATSESEISVVEIGSDDEKSDVDTRIIKAKTRKFSVPISEPVALKRRRGRPPKNRPIPEEIEPPSSVVNHIEEQKLALDIPVVNEKEIQVEKTEIDCPRCSKSFPSQNSLNTHLIHHNLENSLKNKVKMNSSVACVPRKSLLPKFEYNHKCTVCQQTFKNNILLQKHTCSTKQNILNCSVCQKQFHDVTMLNIHKKTHLKSNLIKNTSIAKISPKKSLHKASTNLMKSSKTGFKCKECPKVCDNEMLLNSHVSKSHKKFLCSSCSAAFSSRLLLDTHVRIDCVKFKPPSNRLSFKIRKSFVHTPPRRLSISKKTDKSLNITSNQLISSLKFECEYCNMKFLTYRTLYTHKVQKHGMNTPDKSLMVKPKQGLYKPKEAHCGIPANDKMKKAFAALRMKLAEAEEAVIENAPSTAVTAVQ